VDFWIPLKSHRTCRIPEEPNYMFLHSKRANYSHSFELRFPVLFLYVSFDPNTALSLAASKILFHYVALSNTCILYL
jgi:hypothetical protein